MPELKGKSGIKAFLLDRIGEIVTTVQIREASGGQGQYGRRLRELRDEDGWPIASHNDTPDLKPGEYRLTETPPSGSLVKFARGISAKTRAMVLERNGFTCQMCGIGAGDKDDKGRKARLHMGHIVAKSEGGADTSENLRALCSVCNQGATNLTTAPPNRKLILATLRKANREDQEYAFQWLSEKLGKSTGE